MNNFFIILTKLNIITWVRRYYIETFIWDGDTKRKNLLREYL